MSIAYMTLTGRVRVTPAFYRLQKFEQQAVLAHEEGHKVNNDAWHRLWWILSLRAFFQPDKYWTMCVAQEYRADAYAKKLGHAKGLCSFLDKLLHPNKSSLGYPSPANRIRKLT